MNFVYRVHALERMFQRSITEEEVEASVRLGEVIESYEDDKPYPSYLTLYFVADKALHVVFAKNEEEIFVVITVYEPSLNKWEDDMKTRRQL